MKKLIYRRALEIAADILLREGYCVGPGACPGETEEDCLLCAKRFFLKKAKEELRREART